VSEDGLLKFDGGYNTTAECRTPELATANGTNVFGEYADFIILTLSVSRPNFDAPAPSHPKN